MTCICGVIGIGAQHSGECMMHNRWESAWDEKWMRVQSNLQDAHQQIERLTRERDDARECYRAFAARVAVLERALKGAVADIQWMSGASDFAPGAHAANGWAEVRKRLSDYDRALDGEGKS